MKILLTLLKPLDFIGINLGKIYKLLFANNTYLAYASSMILFILAFITIAVSDYIQTQQIPYIDVFFIIAFIALYYISIKPYKTVNSLISKLPKEERKLLDIEAQFPPTEMILRLPPYVFSRIAGLLVTITFVIIGILNDNKIDSIGYITAGVFMLLSTYVPYLFGKSGKQTQ